MLVDEGTMDSQNNLFSSQEALKSMWDPSCNESFQETSRVEPPSIDGLATNRNVILLDDMAKDVSVENLGFDTNSINQKSFELLKPEKAHLQVYNSRN